MLDITLLQAPNAAVKIFQRCTVFGPDQVPKNNFLNFLLRFLGDLIPVLKVNLEYLKNKN
jgi:hypothetical protein